VTARPDAARAYLRRLVELLATIESDDLDGPIDAAADVVASTLAGGGLVHVFGTGHSHLLALELFYRAGGLAAVDPVLVESLMLHVSASQSTLDERTGSHLDEIGRRHDFRAQDALIVISNSGGNGAPVEVAEFAKSRGLPVVALTSSAHAASDRGRAGDFPLLHIADVVLDNRGVPGDAAVTVGGLEAPMGPTSTVIGAAILNAVAIRAAERLLAMGSTPEVFVSANIKGGDEWNTVLIEKYRGRVGAL